MSSLYLVRLTQQIAGTALLAVALSPAVAQVPSAINPGPPMPQQEGVSFQTATTLPAAQANRKYDYSLCLGRSPAMRVNQECGGPFHPSSTVTGGNPPYHFVLDSGWGFPPLGVHLDKDGNLVGKLAKGYRERPFRVCAVDLGGSQSCQTVTIPAASAAGAKQSKGSGKEAKRGHGGAVALAVIGASAGAGAGIYMAEHQAATSSGSGGACISGRNCIVSVLGSGCECSQSSATGACNWTGAVAQSGQACGAGTPCASGLSCNNGRCEGSGGRCPF